MKSFRHINAGTTGEAAKLMKEYQGKARLVAGGTDLLGVLKDKILPEYPDALINLKTIPGQDYIKEDARGLKIGALARLDDIAKSLLIKEKYRILAEAAEAVATPQIRRMGTIGGNLCQDVRCWYYRFPHQTGGRIECYLKGGKSCYALTRENQNHSIFGGRRVADTPCQSACPGHVSIPSNLGKIRDGKIPEAAIMLLENNPIPAITGRVCPHFCEQACNRGDFDEAVSVRDIERFVGDYILENAREIIKAPETDTGKSVAIIGSGPAGLSAAYYLRMAGHRVTVFDRMEEAGGLLTYAIPAYRLPKDIVKRTVKVIEDTGVEFRLKVDIGNDITLKNLKNKFDGVFIASGAWNPVSIRLEGEESTGFGMRFLTDVNRGTRQAPGKKVLVIGGGNAAIDVAISSLRLGAGEVTMACLERREEMPALPWEIAQAVEEGVRLMPSWGPRKVLVSHGKVTGMELVRCTSVFDKQGCFAPCYEDAVTETIEADAIMMATGYATDLNFASGILKIERGLISVDKDTQATSVPGIFAGGASAHGPATVIEAITSGKRAAIAMDIYLQGPGAIAEKEDGKTDEPFLKFNSDYLRKIERKKAPVIPVKERKIDVEDAAGLSLNEIETAANRCFNCGCLSANVSDTGVVLMALDARVKITGVKGSRTIPIADFFNSLHDILEAGEIVTEIQVPRIPDGTRQAFIKFRIRSAVDFPIVSVASVVALEGNICKNARIVLGSVAPSPLRAMLTEKAIKGKTLNSATVERAAELAVTDCIPLSKNAYKMEITRTLVKRALLS